jgi:altronate hydrolase
MELKHGFFKIAERDNVATALADLAVGEAQVFGAAETVVTIREAVPYGHKTALLDIPEGGDIVKYGCTIGTASCSIRAGMLVGAHNCTSKIGVVEGADAYRPGTQTVYELTEYPRQGGKTDV